MSDSENETIEPRSNTDNILKNKDILFYYKFQDGEIFKSLIEYLNKLENIGNFIFSQDNIFYQSPYDKDSKIINEICINTSELLEAKFMSSENIHLSIELDPFKKMVKSITKGSSVIMIYFSNKENLLFKIIGKEESNMYIKVKPTIKGNEISYPDTSDLERNPNVKLTVSDFCSSCSLITTSNSSLFITPGGINFIGADNKDIMAKLVVRGNPDSSNGINIPIPLTLVKALSKIKTVQSKGIIKILSPIKPAYIVFVIKIGDYGQLKTFIV